MKKSLQRIKCGLKEGMTTTAYRFLSDDFDKAPLVGDETPNSFIWDGDEPTHDELDGTCCFESLEQVKEYSKYSTGWIVKVEGDYAGFGTDLVGEVMIANGVITEVL